ncbi:hypothetical protein Taro_010275 [Colocasia esculenta]|uniref:Pectinesterase inhibitor domain-containing protein n=1 Tax=Colocasia esculenta TaxID=4460 RepID=A0A843U2K7_COLES|nr:hypothetical protein [Colocasia esculenta]
MEGRRRTAAPALALALLALLHVAACAGSAAAARAVPEHHAREVTSPAEFIRSRCGTTEYPHLCVSSLSAYADTIRTSPTQLADAALSVSLSHARSTKALVAKLSAGKDAMGRRVGSAIRDCMETMGDSVDELRESMRAMAGLSVGGKGKGHGKVDLGLQMDNILTWVSAALTDEDTCMDEFAGKAMDGEVKAALRGHVSKVARLTSNALALVNGLSSSINYP